MIKEHTVRPGDKLVVHLYDQSAVVMRSLYSEVLQETIEKGVYVLLLE